MPSYVRSLDDTEFRRLVDEAKSRYNISDVVSRHTKLARAGREVVGICVFHKERSPSLRVHDAKGLYHCFGCGASGDIVRFVMLAEGLRFREALAWLGTELPPVDPAVRARAVAEDAAARAAAVDDARLMWRECVSAEGTPAETYLRDVRGITMEIPAAIRFGVVPTSRDPETGRWKRAYPAMVCACTDDAGEVVGLQRVFLRDDGRDKRWGKRSKLSLGRPRGAAVRLASAGDTVVICEGPEDGLTLAQERAEFGVWAALGASMMPEVPIGPHIRRVILAGDNDDAGRLAIRTAAAAIEAKGVEVAMWFPRAGFKDFNDQLRGVRS